MFTGIIQSVGQILKNEQQGGDRQLSIALGTLAISSIAPGDSIAVNGVCLTARALSGKALLADVSAETLKLTTLAGLQRGSRVNLELALTPSSRLGGHFVSGHVDGVGEVIERRPDARSEQFVVRMPRALGRYIVVKGSVCVAGVSLTVNSVSSKRDFFAVNIVPHTLQMTNLGDCRPGMKVNLEIDMIARYLEGLLPYNTADKEGLSEALLRSSGIGIRH